MVEPRRAVAGERLLGQALGQFCPLIRHCIERARLVPARFFVSRDGIEISRFAGRFRRHAEDLVDDIISGSVFATLCHPPAGSLEYSGQCPHVGVEPSYSPRESQGRPVPRSELGSHCFGLRGLGLGGSLIGPTGAPRLSRRLTAFK